LILIKENFFFGIYFSINSVFVDSKCTNGAIILLEISFEFDEKNGSELLLKSIGNGSPGVIPNAPEVHITYNSQMKIIYLE